MRIKETTYAGEIPVFQIDDATHSVQGGFTLDKTNLVVGDVVGRGAVIDFNEATRSAKVVKTAKVVEAANGTATAYKVAKGHIFKVADKFGTKNITTIDKTNADYDTITVDATIGTAQAVGAVVAEGTYSDYLGLNYHELEVYSGDVEVTVLNSGTVYERRTNGIGAVIGAKMPRVIRSQSY